MSCFADFAVLSDEKFNGTAVQVIAHLQSKQTVAGVRSVKKLSSALWRLPMRDD